jgi:pimeloyl-ACP methyl ester carboxylesterase
MQVTTLDTYRHTTTTRYGEISYLDAGTGPVALFVHGIATNAYLWRYVIGALSSQRRCIAIDLPLHGQSGRGQRLVGGRIAVGRRDPGEPETVCGYPPGGDRGAAMVHVGSAPPVPPSPDHSATRPAGRTGRHVWQCGPHDD